MSPDQEHRLEKLFNAARDLPPLERAVFLEQACAGDAELSRQADSLLAAHEQAGRFLQPTVAFSMPTASVEKPGDRIGRYKLREQIGEGGCGVVYVAEQEEPVRRRVALKVIKLGMDTRNVIARFEAERQALAMMDHPSIAKVLDAGATETGRPYFVMELVRGIKITEYCDQNNLSTRERLALFIQVCQAIQHAHQKGIIHRDIKPSNILVTLNDGVPLPKVIDFGIAKATEGRLTDLTIYTELNQLIGTPAYMSPEQAEMSALDIDTRSDIYSLGVLLYELLTGQTPFDAMQLVAAGLDAMRQTIREKEPPRPSTRLSTMMDADLTRVAKHRQTEPPKLIHLVRGDLDWIVMRALEKVRTRRYETANGLAMDLQRYLTNEPIFARPPSNLYRLQKLVRRNKLLFAAGSLVSASLVIGLGISTFLFFKERLARERAVAAEQQARQARASEAAQRQQAEDARAQEALQKQKATAKAQESLDRLVRLQNANGIGLMEDEDLAAALPWFAAALSLEEGQSEREELQRIRLNSVLQECPKTVQMWFHGGPVTSAQFSRDGRLVVTASRDHTARVWDASSGKPVGGILQHSGIVWQAVFSPDSRRVVTASEDGTASVWDAHTGEPVARPLVHRGPVVSAVFSPNGKMVATASKDHTAQLWDAESGEALAALADHGGTVRQLDFSPDSESLATGGDDAKAWIWQTSTGRRISPIPLLHSAPVTAVKFNTAGNHLLTSSLDGSARIWNVEQYNYYVCPVINHTGPVLHSAFSPNGRYLVTASGAGAARIYEVRSGQPESPELLHRGAVLWAEFDPEGRRVVTASEDHTAAVWVASTGQLVVRLRHGGVVTMAEFSPDGRFVLTASQDSAARLWRLPEGSALYRRVQDEPPTWHSIVGPDGATSVVRDEQQAEVVSIGGAILEGSPGRRIQHAATIRGVVFSPDGRWIATASDDQTARVWFVGTGQPVSPPLEHHAPVWRVAFSPDGRLLATATAERVIQVWDTASGEPVTPNLRQDGPITNLVFSADGRALLASGEGGPQSWNLTPAKLSAQALSGLAELLAGRRLDDTKTSLEPSSAVNLSNLWESVGKRYLPDFEVSGAARRPLPEPSLPRQGFATSQGQRGPGEGASAKDAALMSSPVRPGSVSAHIPDRDPRAGRNQLDLTRFYNAALTQGWQTPEEEKAAVNDLSELPRGLVEFGGVRFDVRGIVQVSGQCMKAYGGRYPEQIKGIPVDRKCAQLYFLHGTGWTTDDGAEIGAYVIHYANGQRRVITITYGEDVRDWFFFDSLPVTSPHARIVWTGNNPKTRANGRAHLQLYLRTWTNPTPDLEITSIDFISAMTCPAPFLIAITVNDISTE